MEMTIKTYADLLNENFIEGIKKMFPNKKLIIKIEEDDLDEETTLKDDYSDEDIKNSPHYIEGDEDATQFILNRPAYAAELRKRIAEYQRTGETITVKPEELL